MCSYDECVCVCVCPDEFSAAPGGEEHPTAGSFGSICSSSSADQRQSDGSAPGERGTVGTSANAAG